MSTSIIPRSSLSSNRKIISRPSIIPLSSNSSNPKNQQTNIYHVKDSRLIQTFWQTKSKLVSSVAIRLRNICEKNRNEEKHQLIIERFKFCVNRVILALRSATYLCRRYRILDTSTPHQMEEKVMEDKVVSQQFNFNLNYYKRSKEKALSPMIVEILRKPISQRTDQKKKIAIYGLTSYMNSFGKFSFDIQRYIVTFGYYVHYQQRRILYRKYQRPLYFYYILKGNGKKKFSNNYFDEVIVLELNLFSSEISFILLTTIRPIIFSVATQLEKKETDLIYNRPRSFSTIVDKDTILLVIDYDTYIPFITNLKEDIHYKSFVDYFHQNDISIDRKIFDRKECCFSSYFRNKQLIWKPNDQTRFLYFIKNGKCLIYKKINFNKSSVILTIGQLGKNSLIIPHQHKDIWMESNGTECLLLDYEEVRKDLNMKTIEKIESLVSIFGGMKFLITPLLLLHILIIRIVNSANTPLVTLEKQKTTQSYQVTDEVLNAIDRKTADFINFPFVAIKGKDFYYLPCDLRLPEKMYEKTFLNSDSNFITLWYRNDRQILTMQFNLNRQTKQAEFQKSEITNYAYFLGQFQQGNFGLILRNVTDVHSGIYRCEVYKAQHGNRLSLPLAASHYAVRVIDRSRCTEKYCNKYPIQSWCESYVRLKGGCCLRCQDEFSYTNHIQVLGKSITKLLKKRERDTLENLQYEERPGRKAAIHGLIILNIVLFLILFGLIFLYNRQVRKILKDKMKL
ncbi:hypothetical protein SNEBB_005516 [Seison nebaliae]|nr:hypothetical protein SNEBB_005516 [Seison nebaliae]